MKIAVITIRNVYGAYVVSRVREAFGDDLRLVIAQEGPAPSRHAGPSPTRARVPRDPARMLRKVYWKAYEFAQLRLTPRAVQGIWNAPDVRVTTNVNAEDTVGALEAAGADLILVFGGRILSPGVLATARKAVLNLHAGKLPEYRGSNTLKWMLWNGEFDTLCATVHIAERGVDAGEIVEEASVALHRSDSFRTIFARLHVAGVEAMVRAATAARAGELRSRPQQGTARTFLAREWTPYHESELDRRLARALQDRLAPVLEKRVVRQVYRRLGPYVAPIRPPRTSSAAVILYHNVEPTESPFVRQLSITMSPRDFEAHIAFLVSHYEVVPFSRVFGRRDQSGVVAVTLDDGLRCIETTVLPIVEKYRCPIKIFVMGERTPDGCNWLNRLSYLLSTMSDVDAAKLESEALGGGTRALHGVQAFIDHFSEDRTIRVVNEAYARAAPPPPERLYLADHELRPLSGHPLVEIGTHTRNHYPLHRLSEASLRDQVVENHRDLVSRLGSRIGGFAAPFGFRHHFTEQVVQAVRDVDGVVVSAYGGQVDHRQLHGVPEVKRIGAWGGVGTLAHELDRHLT